MAIRTAKLGSMAPGLNNRLPPTRLSRTNPDRSTATWLYSAKNVDFTQRGYLRRRRGQTQAIAAPFAHSVWGDEEEGYCVIGQDLVHLRPTFDGLEQAIVRSGMPDLAYLSYARLPDGSVAWSNGYTLGCLRGAAEVPMATNTPTTPSITIGAGLLPAGRYQFAFTRRPAGGIESASTVPVQIDLPENSGVAFGAMDADTLIYMTSPNGDVLNQVIATGGQVLSSGNNGAPLRTLLLEPMPAGSIVRHYRGSLLVAVGNLLVFSEPYYFGLRSPIKGYIPFPKPITVMQPCENGVFVCSDETYWLAGPLMDTQPARVLPYGGLPGSGGETTTTDGADAVRQAFWMSPRGLVIGAPTGNAVNVQEKALKFGDASAGATLFREQDGSHRIIAVRQDAARPFAQSVGFDPTQTLIDKEDQC